MSSSKSDEAFVVLDVRFDEAALLPSLGRTFPTSLLIKFFGLWVDIRSIVLQLAEGSGSKYSPDDDERFEMLVSLPKY